MVSALLSALRNKPGPRASPSAAAAASAKSLLEVRDRERSLPCSSASRVRRPQKSTRLAAQGGGVG